MADAPSPYAPGIVSNEPAAPPRPPGRPVVFLVATFVMTLLAAGLWCLSTGRPMAVSGPGNVDMFAIISNAPAALMLLWAYLSDAVPLWGTRREGYLLLALVTMAVVWLGIAAAGQHPLTWLAAAAPFGLASSVARVAIVGALVEIGQRRAATGRLAAAHVGLAQFAELALRPVILPLTYLSIWLPAGVAAGLALAVVFLIAILPDDDAQVPALAPAPSIGIPKFLKSRPFWAATAVLVCAGLGTVPGRMVMEQVRVAHPDTMESWAARWTNPAIMSGGAVAYLLACGRMNFGALMRLALLAKAATLGAHALASRDLGAATLDPALMLRAAADGFGAAALLDLAMRAAPRGREAFGAILLAVVPTAVMTALMNTMAAMLDNSVESTAWFGMCAAIVGAIAVSLLPREIARRPETRVIGSPA